MALQVYAAKTRHAANEVDTRLEATADGGWMRLFAFGFSLGAKMRRI